MAFLNYFVFALCVIYVSSASTRNEPIEHRSIDDSAEEKGRSQTGPDVSSGIKVLIRAYEQCDDSKDTFQCLKGKALRFVDRALQVENIPLIEGLALVKTEKEATAARALTDADIEDPKTIDGLLIDRMSRFINSHSLQVNMPKITENAKELLNDEQGRGHKLKKLAGPLLMGLMMKGGLMALAFKAVALLAGKALLVAKIALVLAAVIGLSKLAGGKESKVSYEIVKHPHVQHAHTHSSSVVHEGHGGGGWESGSSSGGHGGWDLGGGGGGGGSSGHFRSLDASQSEFVPHVMAYRGQISQEQANGVEDKQ